MLLICHQTRLKFFLMYVMRNYCTDGKKTCVVYEWFFFFLSGTGSKETAFIYAVTSAGVVHAVTQGCSAGELAECSCDGTNHGRSTPEGWKWGGCR